MKGILFLGLAGFPLSRNVYAGFRGFSPPERSLSLHHPGTDQTLNITYWINGEYIPSALTEINYFMRDHRTDEVKPIEPRLLDLLHTLEKKIEIDEPLQIMSGYRSPDTNALLRNRGKRVSNTSFHVKGKAADIYLPGYRLSSLCRVAMGMKAGGVGYYPRSMFVHVDVGPVRHW